LYFSNGNNQQQEKLKLKLKLNKTLPLAGGFTFGATSVVA
jgi:hypothetical protein